MNKIVEWCPLCKEVQDAGNCVFTTVRKVVGEKEYVCCCDRLSQKVKNE